MGFFSTPRVEAGGGPEPVGPRRPPPPAAAPRPAAPPGPPPPPLVADVVPHSPTPSLASQASIDDDDDLPLATAVLGAMPRGVEFDCRVAVFDNTVTLRGLFSKSDEAGTVTCAEGALHYACASERGRLALRDGRAAFRLEAGGGPPRRPTVAVLRTPRLHVAGEREWHFFEVAACVAAVNRRGRGDVAKRRSAGLSVERRTGRVVVTIFKEQGTRASIRELRLPPGLQVFVDTSAPVVYDLEPGTAVPLEPGRRNPLRTATVTVPPEPPLAVVDAGGAGAAKSP